MLYINYEKSSGGGGIVFTPSSLPTANVYVLIVITNAEEHIGSSIDADTVSTDAVSGAANVDEALSALSANMPQGFDVTANTNHFTLNFQSNCVMNGYKIINARFRVDSLPSAADIGMFQLPSGISFANHGGVIPVFKGNEWGPPSTICYGYVAETGIVIHKSDMEVGKYMYVNYCGR